MTSLWFYNGWLRAYLKLTQIHAGKRHGPHGYAQGRLAAARNRFDRESAKPECKPECKKNGLRAEATQAVETVVPEAGIEPATKGL